MEVPVGALISRAEDDGNTPLVSVEELRDMMDKEDFLVVDARPPYAFSQGHIDGAVNFPVDARLGELEDAISELNSRRPKQVVVYCQNTHCQWDSIVANKLKKIGYSNVSVLEGGLNDWQFDH
jgi:rhodanese-related sulfurtransferase